MHWPTPAVIQWRDTLTKDISMSTMQSELLWKWSRAILSVASPWVGKLMELKSVARANRLLFLLDAIIKKDSMTLAKKVLKISPPVPRRMGGKSAEDDSSVFYLKFKSDSDRNEVCASLCVSCILFIRIKQKGSHIWISLPNFRIFAKLCV